MTSPSTPGAQPDDTPDAPASTDGATEGPVPDGGPVLTTDDEAQRDDLLVDPGAS